MTREEAIICLKGIKNYGRDTFNEQSDWQGCLDMAIEALEHEPCEDVISRDEVFKQINCWIDSGEYRYTNATDYLTRRMQGIPHVAPQQMTGHWIYDRTRDWDGECKYECSECGMGSDVDYAYCMRCGAKMIEPQERSDKE